MPTKRGTERARDKAAPTRGNICDNEGMDVRQKRGKEPGRERGEDGKGTCDKLSLDRERGWL